MVAYSAGVQPAGAVLVRARELVDRLRRPFVERQAPLPFLSSLAKALRRDASSSSRSIRPFLSLSAREKRFSSRLLALASGGTGKLRCDAAPASRLLRAAPEAIGMSEPRGFARRGRLRSAAGNRPQPRPENAPRRTSFNIRRFGMAKLALRNGWCQPRVKHGPSSDAEQRGHAAAGRRLAARTACHD